MFDERKRRVERKTGLMQISYLDCVYLFRFSSLKKDSPFPVQVKHLLESENVIRLGRAVKNDFKHIRQ